MCEKNNTSVCAVVMQHDVALITAGEPN